MSLHPMPCGTHDVDQIAVQVAQGDRDRLSYHGPFHHTYDHSAM